MYCHKCGAELSEDSEFCHKCGQAVKKDSVDFDKTSETNDPKQSFFKKHLKKFIAVIVLLCILLVVLLCIRKVNINTVKEISITGDYSGVGYLELNGENYHVSAWREATNESELVLYYESDYFFNVGQKANNDRRNVQAFRYFEKPFKWELNDNLEFIINYTSGDERNIYTYSETSIEENTWHFDKETKTLYLGKREYRPIDPGELKYTVFH